MIHFVYAAPTRPTLPAVRAVQRLGIGVSYLGRRDRVHTEHWPERAPVTITSHIYRLLRDRVPTRLYDVRERVSISGGTNDVLIGHYLAGDERGTWQRACRNGRFAARIAMNPLHHRMPEVCAELEPYIPLVDRVFGIMGPYWYETWAQSALGHWRPKIVPFDMAIDVRAFPRIKTTFNRPGQRRFLYIGWAGAQKGTHLLSILFGLARHHRCVAVGPAHPLPNIDVRPRRRFTPSYLQRLASECDFLLVPGVSDANPTVVLEAMAWGFPVACTPQSGYLHPGPESDGLTISESESDVRTFRLSDFRAPFVPLSIADMRHNLAVLDMLQEASESDLLARAASARALVEQHYTWARFETTFIRALNDVLIEKGLAALPGPAEEAALS